MSLRSVFLALLIAIGVAACAADDPHRRAKTGAAVGATVGAILGHQLDDGSGTFVGAAIGALAGGAVGNYMDNQQAEFEQALADEQRRHEIEIERLKDDTLKLSVNSEVSFDFDKANIKSAFRPTLDKLGDILLKYNRTVVHIVGHTDNIGTAKYNLELSQRRADAVSAYLKDRGVPGERIRTEGRGESEPRADNLTESGRQLNRRVELYVKPIIEGQEQKAYEPPPRQG